MPEINNVTSQVIEALSLHHVLEGLVHNINTPLNIIIGYSQQLKKQYPDIKYLEKITEAGLEIDDLVKACSEAFVNRTDSTEETFGLNQWLENEIRLLKNNLEIKHALRFDTYPSATEVKVTSRPLILSLFFESLVLVIRNKCESSQADRSVGVQVLTVGTMGILEISLPGCSKPGFDIQVYVHDLLSELSAYHEAQDSGFPFTVEVSGSNLVKILFKK
jgi:signal transduction histidine kinase